MDYLTFRANALSSLTLLKRRDNFPPKWWSKDDIEKWVKKEYERHYKSNKQV
jgi:hypothetical protein